LNNQPDVHRLSELKPATTFTGSAPVSGENTEPIGSADCTAPKGAAFLSVTVNVQREKAEQGREGLDPKIVPSAHGTSHACRSYRLLVMTT